MKKNSVAFIFLIIAAVILTAVIFPKLLRSKATLSVERAHDGKGILVGAKLPQFEEKDPNKLSPETRKRVESYRADVKAIDDAHQYSMAAYQFEKNGELDKAAEMYLKAYETDKGSRHVSGFYLAETYEKLARYDDAIAILDNMIKNGETNEYGIQKANEMKARLLAAKNAETPQSNNG